MRQVAVICSAAAAFLAWQLASTVRGDYELLLATTAAVVLAVWYLLASFSADARIVLASEGMVLEGGYWNPLITEQPQQLGWRDIDSVQMRPPFKFLESIGRYIGWASIRYGTTRDGELLIVTPRRKRRLVIGASNAGAIRDAIEQQMTAAGCWPPPGKPSKKAVPVERRFS